MQIVGSRGAAPAERVEAASDSVRFAVGRPSASRITLGIVLVAAIGWLIAAPSAPAVIVAVSALIACVGWGSEPAGPLLLSED